MPGSVTPDALATTAPRSTPTEHDLSPPQTGPKQVSTLGPIRVDIPKFGLIITQIGTAVVLYPLARRQSETLSLGYVTARIVESVFTAIGIISIISVVNIVDSLASATGADAAALAASGNSLVHSYEWAFQWGPGLVAGIGNGLILGYLMYRSALVPPRMALDPTLGDWTSKSNTLVAPLTASGSQMTR